MGFSLVAQTVKRLSTMRETRVRALGWEDPLEKEMAIHSSTIAWKILWTEEPGGLQTVVAESQTRPSMAVCICHCCSPSLSSASSPCCVHKPVLYVCVSVLARVAIQMAIH